MMIKRLLSLILILVLALSCMPMALADGEDISVVASFGSAMYKKGESATLTIRLNGTKNNPVAAADFEIEYNSANLSVVRANKLVTSYKAGGIVKNSSDLSISCPSNGKMKLLFMDNSNDRSRSITNNGVLLTIQFKVLSDVKDAKSLIKLVGSGDFCSETLQIYNVAFSVDIVKEDQAGSTSNQNNQNNQNNQSITAKKPYKVKGVKLTAGKKKLTVKWKKAKNAKKYRVKYSYKKNMKKAKYKTVKKTKVVIKKLKSGKRVYVQVQGVNGKVKGKFSKKNVKKIK